MLNSYFLEQSVMHKGIHNCSNVCQATYTKRKSYLHTILKCLNISFSPIQISISKSQIVYTQTFLCKHRSVMNRASRSSQLYFGRESRARQYRVSSCLHRHECVNTSAMANKFVLIKINNIDMHTIIYWSVAPQTYVYLQQGEINRHLNKELKLKKKSSS